LEDARRRTTETSRHFLAVFNKLAEESERIERLPGLSPKEKQDAIARMTGAVGLADSVEEMSAAKEAESFLRREEVEGTQRAALSGDQAVARYREAVERSKSESATYQARRGAIISNTLAADEVRRSQRDHSGYVARNSTSSGAKHAALSRVADQTARDRDSRKAANDGLQERQQALASQGKPLSSKDARELARLRRDEPGRAAENARLDRAAEKAEAARHKNVMKNGPKIAEDYKNQADEAKAAVAAIWAKVWSGKATKHSLEDLAALLAQAAAAEEAAAAVLQEHATGVAPKREDEPPEPEKEEEAAPPGCPPNHEELCCPICEAGQVCVCAGSEAEPKGAPGAGAEGVGAGVGATGETLPYYPPPPPPLDASSDAIATIRADGQGVGPAAQAPQPETTDCRTLLALIADLWNEYKSEWHANAHLERDSQRWQTCSDGKAATVVVGGSNPCVHRARAFMDQRSSNWRLDSWNARGIHEAVRSGEANRNGRCTEDDVFSLQLLAEALAQHTLVLHAASVVRRLAGLACLFSGLAARHPTIQEPSYSPENGLHHKVVSRPFANWSTEFGAYMKVSLGILSSVCVAFDGHASSHEAWIAFEEGWLPHKAGLDALAERVRKYIAGMRRVEDETLAAQATLKELLLGEVAGFVAFRVLRFIARSVRVHMRRSSLPSKASVPEQLRRLPDDWTPDEASDALDQLAREGHAPQRHEGQVRLEEHARRIHDGIDPATNSSIDIETKLVHDAVPTSSSFTSEEAMAQAAAMVRRDEKYIKLSGEKVKNQFAIEIPLEDALGFDYLRHVEGYTRKDVSTLALKAVDYTGGKVLAFLKAVRDPSTNKIVRYRLVTMYPIPR
jgi:hypothetical protein